MSEVIVPAIFEQTLSLSDGSSGPSLSEALQFDRQEVSNLYSYAEGLFQFAFTERSVGYGDSEATTQQAKTSFQVRAAWGVGQSIDRQPYVYYFGYPVSARAEFDRLIYMY